jgi:hypothetical protein
MTSLDNIALFTRCQNDETAGVLQAMNTLY